MAGIFDTGIYDTGIFDHAVTDPVVVAVYASRTGSGLRTQGTRNAQVVGRDRLAQASIRLRTQQAKKIRSSQLGVRIRTQRAPRRRAN